MYSTSALQWLAIAHKIAYQGSNPVYIYSATILLWPASEVSITTVWNVRIVVSARVYLPDLQENLVLKGFQGVFKLPGYHI